MSRLSSACEARACPKTGNCNGIDLIKFLCVFLIIACHITPFQGGGSAWAERINYWTYNYFNRVAVPFYFTASGFFLFRKMSLSELNVERIKSYCFRILAMSAIWRMILIYGPIYHLWYLDATVIAVAVVGVCLRLRVKFRYIAAVAAGFYAIGLMGDAYYAVTKPLENVPILGILRMLGNGQSGIFVGFPFILMGAYLAHHPPKMKVRTAFVGFAVSMLCMFGEAFFLLKTNPRSCTLLAFLPLATFFLFAFAHNLGLKDRPIYRRLRSVALLTYLLHMMVDVFARVAIAWANTSLGVDFAPYRYFVTVAMTLLTATAICLISSRKSFKWLNWII